MSRSRPSCCEGTSVQSHESGPLTDASGQSEDIHRHNERLRLVARELPVLAWWVPKGAGAASAEKRFVDAGQDADQRC